MPALTLDQAQQDAHQGAASFLDRLTHGGQRWVEIPGQFNIVITDHRAVYESDLAELLKTMALSGHGLAWLPESCIARELAEGKLVRAGADQWTLRLEIRLFRAIERRKPVLDELWRRLG